MAERTAVDAAAGSILRALMVNYPMIRRHIIRASVKWSKAAGTPSARRVLEAMLREFWTDIHGSDATTSDRLKHQFLHWMRDKPLDTDLRDPIQGVDGTDAFLPVAEDIT